MTQEEKELLLKEISARLPYKVKASYYGTDEEMECTDIIEGIIIENNDAEIIIGQYGLSIEKIKPYLFPLSSLTSKQKVELLEIVVGKEGSKYFKVLYDGSICSTDAKEQDLNNFVMHIVNFDRKTTASFIDWLYKHHIDYRGLIKKGLALDATNLNIY